ncbi:MAG: helix-turn-helix domain-containing protein [Thermodesulfobacteriota bacterium]|jgi:excisionase family DNA binding protein
MPDLLSLKESVKELGGAKESGGGISIHTFRAWIYQKRIPYVKLGRRVFLRREDLEEFVSKNLHEARDQR